MRGSQDGLWDWDLSTDQVYWSRQWAAIMGLDVTELCFDEWWALIHNDDLQRVQDALDAHLDGTTEHLEVEYRVRYQNFLQVGAHQGPSHSSRRWNPNASLAHSRIFMNGKVPNNIVHIKHSMMHSQGSQPYLNAGPSRALL